MAADEYPMGRLIIKAAHRLSDAYMTNEPRKNVERALAQVTAFAEVAADILHRCPAPFAFEIALRDAVTAHPRPYLGAAARGRALVERAAWEQSVCDAVLEKLGHG